MLKINRRFYIASKSLPTLIILCQNFFGALNAIQSVKRIAVKVFRNVEESVMKLQGRIPFNNERMNGKGRLTRNVSYSRNSRIDGNGCKRI